jgi:hypothetical protein
MAARRGEHRDCDEPQDAPGSAHRGGVGIAIRPVLEHL